MMNPDTMRRNAFFNFLLAVLVCGLNGNGNVYGQSAIYGGNQFQTFSSAGTTNGPSTDGIYNLISSVGQPAAISSQLLAQTQAGILTAASAGLLNPVAGQLVITPTPATSFQPGVTPFTVRVTDAVNIANAQLHFKPIAAAPSSFDSVQLVSQSTSATSKTYSQNISNTSWYDDMGIEYFYTAKDANGSWRRNPVAGSFYSQLTRSPLALSQITSLPVNPHYKMVAFPYDSGSSPWPAATVYKITSDKSAARMFHWNSTTRHYLEFADGGFSTVTRGNGYWLLYASSPSLIISHVTAPSENRTSLFRITLAAKSWNQIGNPYPVPIRWSDVLALDANKGVDPNILSKLNIYNGTSYDSAANSTLEPFEGGFIYNFDASDVSVYVPFEGQTQLGDRTTSTAVNISDPAWNVFLHIRQDDQSENLISGFGMNPRALAGPDRYDNFNPPPIVSLPEVDFQHPEYPGFDFGNDIVPVADAYQWQFTTRGDGKKETVLTWNQGIESGNRQLFLFDPATLAAVDMLATDHYTFVQQGDNSFRIYFGSDARSLIQPDDLKITGPFPNPVSADRTLHFSIAVPDKMQNSSLRLAFFNGTGQPAGLLDQSVTPGLHDLNWMFRPELAPGIYLYRLTIGNGSSQATYTGKILLP